MLELLKRMEGLSLGTSSVAGDMKFNKGGRDVSADNSDYGVQINDKFWSKVAIKASRRTRVFTQLGDKLTQPKNYGDKLIKYVEIPIIDKLNVNDQGIDANGVKLLKGTWFAYDATGAMIVAGATVTVNGAVIGYADKEAAKVAAGATGTIKSGDGNLFGGDSDIAVVKGSFPALSEEGGKVNAVGMKRLTKEASVTEFGFHIPFTKKALEMDTEQGLLARMSMEAGEAYGDLREKQVAVSLLTEAGNTVFYAGTSATSNATVDQTSFLTFQDIRAAEQELKFVRSPKQTKIIDGSNKVGTTVVGAGYVAYVGQELYPTLEDMETAGIRHWKPVETYAAAGIIMDGEIGKISSTRFIEVEEMPYFAGTGASVVDGDDADATTDNELLTVRNTNGKVDVFPVLYVGTDSFATIGFEGDVARVETIMPKADAHNDVFGKKGAVAISWYYGFMCYRPERILQIRTAAKYA